MAWIESHQDLRKHPKTLMAVTALHVDRHKFIGHLHCLWWWGLDVADLEGRLPSGTTPAVIADAAEWPVAKAQSFVAALMDCKGNEPEDTGFLELLDGRYILHDWWEYAGKYNAKRAANKERMANARADHVQRTTNARAAHVQGLPIRSDPILPILPTDPTGTTDPTSARAPDHHPENPARASGESARTEILRRYRSTDGGLGAIG